MNDADAALVKAQVEALMIVEREKQQALMIAEREKQQEKDKPSLDLTRKMRIEQVKGRFKDPANKRAVGHILELQFDMEDFQSKYMKLVNPDTTLVDVEANRKEVESFMEYCSRFGNMMMRKLSKERESYEIANRSSHSWLTEKFFREEEIFDTNDEDKAWYESDDLSKEEKLKKLRSAERQAVIALRQKKQFARKLDQGQRGRKRPRWGPDLSAPSAAGAPPPPADGRFGPQQLFYPPPSRGPQCFGCGDFGHIRRDCTKKKH